LEPPKTLLDFCLPGVDAQESPVILLFNLSTHGQNRVPRFLVREELSDTGQIATRRGWFPALE